LEAPSAHSRPPFPRPSRALERRGIAVERGYVLLASSAAHAAAAETEIQRLGFEYTCPGTGRRS
jgi:hypothetical protein